MPTYTISVSRAAQADWTAFEFADGETLNIEVQRSAEVVGSLFVVFSDTEGGDALVQKAFTGDAVALRAADMVLLAEGGSWFADIIEVDGVDQYRVRKGRAIKLPSILLTAPPPTAPAFTADPVITGTLEVGQTLTVSDGTTTGTLPITYTYAWSRGGITTQTYLLGAGDAGQAAPSCTVTAANGTLPNATATAPSIGTVPAAATAPAQIGAGDWSLADSPSAGGNTLTLTIITLPADGGSAITALQYRVGGGAAQTLIGTGTGARQITVLAETLASVEVRAVNAVGDGAWSAAKTATPTVAAGNTAPTITTQPSLSPASGPVGTVFTLSLGVAEGDPAPTVSVLTFTQAGVDVSGSISGNEFTSTAEGAIQLVTTAINGVSPNAVSSTVTATVTAAGVPTIPNTGAYEVSATIPGVNAGNSFLLDPNGQVVSGTFQITDTGSNGGDMFASVLGDDSGFVYSSTLIQDGLDRDHHANPTNWFNPITGKHHIAHTVHNAPLWYMYVQDTVGDYTAYTRTDLAAMLGLTTQLTYTDYIQHDGSAVGEMLIFTRDGTGVNGDLVVAKSTDGGVTFGDTMDGGVTSGTTYQLINHARRVYPTIATNPGGTQSLIVLGEGPLDVGVDATSSRPRALIYEGGVFKNLAGTTYGSLPIAYSSLDIVQSTPGSTTWNSSSAAWLDGKYVFVTRLCEDAIIDDPATRIVRVKVTTVDLLTTPGTPIIDSTFPEINIGPPISEMSVCGPTLDTAGGELAVYVGQWDSAAKNYFEFAVYLWNPTAGEWIKTVARTMEFGAENIGPLPIGTAQPRGAIGFAGDQFGNPLPTQSDSPTWEQARSMVTVNTASSVGAPDLSLWRPTISTAAQTLIDLATTPTDLLIADLTQGATVYNDRAQQTPTVGDRVKFARNLAVEPALRRAWSLYGNWLDGATAAPTRAATGLTFDGTEEEQLYTAMDWLHGLNRLYAVRFTLDALDGGGGYQQLIKADVAASRYLQFRLNNAGLEHISFNTSNTPATATAAYSFAAGQEYVAIAWLNGTQVNARVVPVAAPGSAVSANATLAGTVKTGDISALIASNASITASKIVICSRFPDATDMAAEVAAAQAYLLE